MPTYKNILLVCLLLAHLLYAMSPTANAKTDPRLAVFIHQVEQLKDTSIPLKHPDNPLYPYLDRPFEDGFTDQDKLVFQRAMESGDCFTVNRTIEKAFLQLYPFLEPAFQTVGYSVPPTFLLEIGYRGPSNHCQELHRLKQFEKARSIKTFHPLDVIKEVNEKYYTRTPYKPENLRDMLISIHFGFGLNAFCQDYHLSILQVIKTANKPGGMILTPEEELYLTERAHKHGSLEIEDYASAIEILKRKFNSAKRFDQLRIASRLKKIRLLEGVQGTWQKTCQKSG